MNILLILNIILLGIYFFYFVIYSKIKKQEQLQYKQQELQNKIVQLNSVNKKIEFNQKLISDYQNQILNNQKQLNFLHQQQKELEDQLKSKEEYLNKYYNSIKNNSEQAFNSYENILNKAYQQKEEEFNNKISSLKQSRDLLQTELDQLKSTYQAAAAAQIREKEKEDEWRFYSIHLSDNEASDIAKLQKWKTDLFDPSIVSKVIWSAYIIKPTGDLCNRVLGSDKVCGIYKLTDKSSGRVYIGQSVNVSQRWRQHIKCGLGVDTPPASATKLYKAMQGSSLWYWTFELIEKCPSSKLNEREKYWIDFYQSDKIGYNSQKGNR